VVELAMSGGAAGADVVALSSLNPCTVVAVQMIDNVDSTNAQPGDFFRFETVNAVTSGNRIVIPARTIGYGIVAVAAPAGRGGRPGTLVLEPRYLDMPGHARLGVVLDHNASDLEKNGKSGTAPGYLGAIPVPVIGAAIGISVLVHLPLLVGLLVGAGHDAGAPAKPASGQPANAAAGHATSTSAGTLQATRQATTQSAQSASALEARGHDLMMAGQYQQAIGFLRQAVASAPSSSLTYAYALYDLGRALRLDGQTASALAVLGERLQIDNQRPVVEEEIALARGAGADTGAGPAAETPAAAPPQGPARRRAHDGARRRGHARSPLTRSGGIAAAG